ncbi:Hypp3792 [Branchiostoma lanceolatum]|uniref:Hypp3792 protein n=1 Tax=Branchiostoma lanceolatum TaxID=7740 RepID=A0A8K0A236_BRALA|nr:Hypp3792 [Branchiostoma lanceolatum]
MATSAKPTTAPSYVISEEQVEDLRAMATRLGMEEEVAGALQHMQQLSAEHKTLKAKIETLKEGGKTSRRQENASGAQKKSVMLPKRTDRSATEKEDKSPRGILATVKSHFQKLRSTMSENTRDQPPPESKEPETATGLAAPVTELKKRRKKKKKPKQSPPQPKRSRYHDLAIAGAFHASVDSMWM